MRQVPSYLIIGNGRVACHIAHYLTLLDIQYNQWDRSIPKAALQSVAAQATHILLLISDDAIEPFIQIHLQNTAATLVHFSGSLVTQTAFGAHPLMTFGQALYDKACYESIPFIIDEHAPSFEHLLPGLSNSHARLSTSQKAKYHALCVLSGNFSCMLWQKLMSTFEQEFQISASFIHPYLERQMNNILSDYKSALTGPLVRKDENTINKNLAAMVNDPFQMVYQAFVDCYMKWMPACAGMTNQYEIPSVVGTREVTHENS